MDSPEKNISITRDSPTKKEYKLNESKFAQIQLFFHLKIFQITQKIGRKKTCLFFVILGCLLQAGSSLFLKLTIYDYPKIRLSQSIFYRTVFSVISQFFIFYALEFIEIGEVMVIYMTFPVWNVLGGKIFNGEQIQCKKYFYGLISLLGFLIMLEPDYIFSKFHYFDELNESIHETIQQDGENMDLITYMPQRFRDFEMQQ
ncbi:hypothetical protein PPERSA_07121 [Pseudocohnilembus persalinus]|uniref:EamA domain-containing protein n=1 Tax=Pseudocohnilembus persalinus TaxID=266149 RepID=A0A0V0QXP4_PSEPJ|nr:hypothetical protein PPERSA_07121 [Pseudocohnilembus persalinus]|eukprot:KRX06958.1 hypothetical protein PPERSA_07121 [Pseudocohnilembus persalinus]